MEVSEEGVDMLTVESTVPSAFTESNKEEGTNWIRHSAESLERLELEVTLGLEASAKSGASSALTKLSMVDMLVLLVKMVCADE